MTAYLAIIRYGIQLANAIAQRLQQHHDEISGENKKTVEIAANEKAAVDGDHIRDANPAFDQRVQRDHGIDVQP